jgi:hypothetical protein
MPRQGQTLEACPARVASGVQRLRSRAQPAARRLEKQRARNLDGGVIMMNRANDDCASNEGTSAIVVGIDFDVTSERALDEALELTMYRPEVQLHVVHADESVALDAHQVIAHFRLSAAAEAVVQIAVDVDADLIVVGTHARHGVERLVLGSAAAKILDHARCPVLVVRRKDHERAGDVPHIEPPCAECVAVRKRSGGAIWWCEGHHTHTPIHPHHYSYVSRRPSAPPAPWGASFG